MSSQNQWSHKTDKFLVAEQPGWGFSFFGIIVALFIGLIFRSILSPDRVKAHLTKASENIHKDLSIQFDQAYVSLSNGSFPELAVVVKNIRMSSNDSCWMEPTIEIDEMKLPLSFQYLIQGKIFISDIFANSVNLSLAAPLKECKRKDVKLEIQKDTPVVVRAADLPRKPAQVQAGQNIPIVFETAYRENPIEGLRINQLNVHYLPMMFTSFYFKNIDISKSSIRPLEIKMRGQMLLGYDSVSQGTVPLANLSLDYIEGETPGVTSEVMGSWGEGHFNLKSNLDLKSNQLKIEGGLQYFPLVQLVPLLKKYRVIKSDFSGKSTWLSGNFDFQSSIRDLNKGQLKFNDLKVEGDIGELTCSSLVLTSSNNQIQYEPFLISAKSLKVKDFLTIYSQNTDKDFIGDLGQFHGSIKVDKNDSVKISGDYSGLEFIFSNRGYRKAQKISLISGEVEIKKKQFSAVIDRLKPELGRFEGSLRVIGDRDLNSVKLKFDVSELVLDPAVQSLMTGGGYLETISGVVSAVIENKKMIQLASVVKTNGIKIDDIVMQKIKIKGNKLGAEPFRFSIGAESMQFSDSGGTYKLLNKVLEGRDPIESQFTLMGPEASISVDPATSSLNWNSFDAKLGKTKIRSEGSWNHFSELQGKISLTDKKTFSWKIFGTRNRPEIEPL